MGFFLDTASRPAEGPIQPPIRWEPGALTPVLKRPGREADRTPLPNTEVKNAWNYTSTPPVRLHDVVLS
jgi:hypothetical protein